MESKAIERIKNIARLRDYGILCGVSRIRLLEIKHRRKQAKEEVAVTQGEKKLQRSRLPIRLETFDCWVTTSMRMHVRMMMRLLNLLRPGPVPGLSPDIIFSIGIYRSLLVGSKQ